MANDKISMPSSGAGIMRYFDEYRSKIEFGPGHVVVLSIIIMLLIILLNRFGASWLGI